MQGFTGLKGLRKLLQGLLVLCVLGFYGCEDGNPLTDKEKSPAEKQSCAFNCDSIHYRYKDDPIRNQGWQACITNNCECKLTATTSYSCD